MRVLVTIPDSPVRSLLIPPPVERRLETISTVEWNDTDGQFSEADLQERLPGVDVCITGWGSPILSAEVLDTADNLSLVAHVGGSVATVASEALYDRGVTVCSAVRVMAPFVAEGILGYVLASLRELPSFDAALKRGEWTADLERTETLFGTTVGFVGLGTVGEALLPLLEPFDVDVLVFDPYVDDGRLNPYEFASMADLDAVLRGADVVSIHAAKTRETIDMLDAERLALLRDGALLVNAARGAIVDHCALINELRSGRISAVLDVFEKEPLPADSELRRLDSVVLVPHMAGAPARWRLGEAMVAEIERFATGNPLRHMIPRERFAVMTADGLSASDGER